RRTTGLRPPPRRTASPGAAGERRSGAVATVHALLVCQLAPVLHEIALAARELGGLLWDHLHRECLDRLFPPEGKARLLFLFFLGGGSLLGLRGQDLLEARVPALRFRDVRPCLRARVVVLVLSGLGQVFLFVLQCLPHLSGHPSSKSRGFYARVRPGTITP